MSRRLFEQNTVQTPPEGYRFAIGKPGAIELNMENADFIEWLNTIFPFLEEVYAKTETYSKTEVDGLLFVKTKIAAIGTWNMNEGGQDQVTVDLSSLNITNSKVRQISVIIFANADYSVIPMPLHASNAIKEVGGFIGGGTVSGPGILQAITLHRTTGGCFYNSLYNDTTSNRGYVKIDYIP